MRKKFWPSVATLLVFLLLISLGTWQVKRLYQKQQLIIEASKQINLPALEMSCKELRDQFTTDLYYRKINIKGHYLSQENIFIYAGPMAIRGKPGYLLISEFECLDKAPMIVNQGWVEMSAKEQFKYNDPHQVIEFSATIMPEEKAGMFTPANDLTHGLWYYINFQDIEKLWKLENSSFYLMRNYVDSHYPIGKDAVVKIRNDHLSYAITWYSLAFILLVMYYFRFIRRSEIKKD